MTLTKRVVVREALPMTNERRLRWKGFGNSGASTRFFHKGRYVNLLMIRQTDRQIRRDAQFGKTTARFTLHVDVPGRTKQVFTRGLDALAKAAFDNVQQNRTAAICRPAKGEVMDAKEQLLNRVKEAIATRDFRWIKMSLINESVNEFEIAIDNLRVWSKAEWTQSERGVVAFSLSIRSTVRDRQISLLNASDGTPPSPVEEEINNGLYYAAKEEKKRRADKKSEQKRGKERHTDEMTAKELLDELDSANQ